jgi:hypothetical protein
LATFKAWQWASLPRTPWAKPSGPRVLTTEVRAARHAVAPLHGAGSSGFRPYYARGARQHPGPDPRAHPARAGAEQGSARPIRRRPGREGLGLGPERRGEGALQDSPRDGARRRSRATSRTSPSSRPPAQGRRRPAASASARSFTNRSSPTRSIRDSAPRSSTGSPSLKRRGCSTAWRSSRARLCPGTWPEADAAGPALEAHSSGDDELSKAPHHRRAKAFVDTIRRQIPELEAFVRDKDLLTQDPTRPLQVREMPATCAAPPRPRSARRAPSTRVEYLLQRVAPGRVLAGRGRVVPAREQ